MKKLIKKIALLNPDGSYDHLANFLFTIAGIWCVWLIIHEVLIIYNSIK